MSAYEQVAITPELLALLNGEWSEPVQVQAQRQSNGSLSLAFRNYSAPVMVSGDEERGPRLGKRGPRAADQ